MGTSYVSVRKQFTGDNESLGIEPEIEKYELSEAIRDYLTKKITDNSNPRNTRDGIDGLSFTIENILPEIGRDVLDAHLASFVKSNFRESRHVFNTYIMGNREHSFTIFTNYTEGEDKAIIKAKFEVYETKISDEDLEKMREKRMKLNDIWGELRIKKEKENKGTRTVHRIPSVDE